MAISQEWTDIVDGQVDADSPVNQILMQTIKDDLYHNKYWIGKDYTPADNHDHDGVNSKSVVLGDGVVTETKIADGAVAQGKLKFAEGSWSALIYANTVVQFSINNYSHLTQNKMGTAGALILFHMVWQPPTDDYYYKLTVENGDTDNDFWAYAKWHYHSSSPPPEVWIELSKDGKRIVQVWKSEPIGHKGKSVPPIDPRSGNPLIRFGQIEMLGHMRSHDRYKIHKPADLLNYHLYQGLIAEEIAMDEQWQEIMIIEGRKKAKK